MKIIIFQFLSDRMVHVAAANVQDALRLLCDNDYFVDEEEDGAVHWNDVPDDSTLTIWLDDDPDAEDLAMPGAIWNSVKHTLTAPASSWAGKMDTTRIVGDSEC